jgi:hypothetical protein
MYQIRAFPMSMATPHQSPDAKAFSQEPRFVLLKLTLLKFGSALTLLVVLLMLLSASDAEAHPALQLTAVVPPGRHS